MNNKDNKLNPDAALGWGERLGYGAGGVGYYLIFSIIGAYLTMYLTNVVFLDIAAVSTIIAVSKVFDGISDVIIGNIVDNTSSKYGKARIWLIRMSVPLAFATVLLFMVPAGFPQIVKYIYVFILYNLVNAVFLTFMQISYLSMISLLSGDRNERGLLGNIQSISRNVALLAGNALFVKLLMLFTSDPQNQNTQRAYFCTMLVYSLIMVILILICFFTTKERVMTKRTTEETGRTEADKMSFMETFKIIAADKYWIIMVIAQIFSCIATQMMTTGGAYYALYVLGDMDNVSWIMATALGPSLIIQFLTPLLMKKFGKNKIFYLGAALMAIGGAGFGFAAPFKPAMILFNIIKSLGTGMYNSMLFGIIADIISYTKQKTGLFMAGMGNAGVSAATKLGQGLGNVLLGFGMSLVGFNGALKVQPDAVATVINIMFVWVPVLIYAVIFIVFILFFDLEKQMEKREKAHETR